MGCEEAQGYLYSKPVTATEFAELFAHKILQGNEYAN
jgi:EAL domain-containing protein (putative c-di-GMP-specific phosphodiesterase class I)